MSTQKKKFSPFEIFEDLKNANLDPSIFEKVDERDFDKAPNFIDWALEPKFASTTVLPKQIEIGTKLCMEWCPRCSNPGYIDTLFDQTIGNIKDNIVFLEHGVCPKCKSHRLELVNEFNIEMKNELVGAMGQRCVPKGTLIFTDRGVLPIEKVKVGDLLSHGRVSEVYDSGVRPCTSVTTEHGWVLRGATDTHIVAVLAGCSIMWKKLCEVVPGDTLLLCSPGLYSSEPDDEVKFTFVDDAVLSASAENQRKWLFTLLGTTDLSTPNLKFFTSSASVAAKARLLLLNMGIFSTSYVFEDYHRVTVLPQTSPIVVEGSEYFPVKVLSSERTPDVHMYDVHVPGTNAYAGDGFLHHNSGKTKTVGLLASYITHRFLKIPNPLRYFGQPTGELLLGTFSALTLEQASQTLWESYKGFVNGSPWFSQYHSFLKAEGKRLGVELLHDLKTSTLYSHKQMLWHATGSQDRKMRGKTRIFAAIDELGWFIMDESKPDLQNMNADGVYTALSNSLATMRMKHRILLSRGEYDAPPILMANVSSPSSAKDKIMRLIKDANRNHKILALALPTWHVNPDYTYESLREEFNHIEDSIFMRDFGVEPPLAQSPYLSDEKVVARICTGTVTKDIEVTPYEDLSSAFVSVRTKINTQNKSVPRILTFDLGATKNGLAACLFSMSSSGKPVLDFVLSIKPTSKLRVNIADVFDNFTAPIIKSLNIKCVYFDRWQSLDQVERIRGLGVEAQVYSLTYKDMDSVRGYINSEAVVIPALPKPIDAVIQDYVSDAPGWWSTPTSDLCIQLLTVRDTGHKMLKPSHGDDDIFRAFCLGVVKMYDPAVKLLTMVQNPTAPQITGGHLGGVIPRSSGGFGRGGTGRVEGVGVSMSRQRRR